jgi:predicted metal-dependent hydrolase
MMNLEVKIHGTTYPVVIEKKKNKNTYIRVNQNFEIYVTTSYFVTGKAIIKLLKENEDAIYKMIEKKRKEQEREKKFYYLGQEYEIYVMPTNREVEIYNHTIMIPSEKKLQSFLKNQMKELFTKHYDYWYQQFEEPIHKPKLKFRKMKTRWGVCNRRDDSITLNTRLLEYDTKYLDYVIIHELSHLVHFDHSKAFWEVVSKYCPDYQILRKEMRD